MAKKHVVGRPTKKSEYTIVCASRQAEKGWTDLKATQLNVLVDTWDFLTTTPMVVTPTNYPMKGELETLTRDGTEHKRWQHKPSVRGTARIWFYIVDRTVYLENVHTSHPNETK